MKWKSIQKCKKFIYELKLCPKILDTVAKFATSSSSYHSKCCNFVSWHGTAYRGYYEQK